MIHHSALPHLQSHAAFTHSQPRSALTLSAGAVRTPLPRPERPPGLCGCGRSVGNWGGVWGLGLKKAKQLSPEIPPLLGVSRYFPGKQLCLVVNPSCAECKDPALVRELGAQLGPSGQHHNGPKLHPGRFRLDMRVVKGLQGGQSLEQASWRGARCPKAVSA